MAYSGNIKKVSFDGSVKPRLIFDQERTPVKPQRFNQKAKLAKATAAKNALAAKMT